MGLIDRLRKMGKNKLADSLASRKRGRRSESELRARRQSVSEQREEMQRSPQLSAGEALQKTRKRRSSRRTRRTKRRERTSVPSVADAGTSTRIDTPQSHTDALDAFDAQQQPQFIPQETQEITAPTQATVGLPEIPEGAPEPIEAPEAPEEVPTSEELEGEVEVSVRDQFQPVFDTLSNIGELATQGRESEIALARSQAQEIFALYDQQLEELKSIKEDADTTAEERAELEREEATIARERQLAQNEFDKAEFVASGQKAERERERYNEAQKIRLETFAGLKNGFGSSAQITNLENVMNEGQYVLDDLRISVAKGTAEYGRKALTIEENHAFNLQTINFNKNATLQSNYDDLRTDLQRITENKLLTSQESKRRELEAYQKYNDKVEENAIRAIENIKEMNNTIREESRNLRLELMQNEQTKSNYEWQKANFDLNVAQYGEEVARNSRLDQLNLWSTVNSIILQEKGLDLDRNRLAQNLQQHQDNLKLANDQFEQNKIEFGQEFALSEYVRTAQVEENAMRLALDEYQVEQRVLIDNKNLFLTEQSLYNSTLDDVKNYYEEFTDPETGQTMWYDPVNNVLRTPVELQQEAEDNSDFQYFKQATTLMYLGKDKEQADMNKILYNTIDKGDINGARKLVTNMVLKNSGDIGSIIRKSQDIVSLVENIEQGLEDFYAIEGAESLIDSGIIDDAMQDADIEFQGDIGDTGIWEGGKEKFMNYILKRTNNPQLATLATQIASTLPAYTVAISGAQFSEKELRIYEQSFPSIMNSQDLNMAKIKGLLKTWRGIKRDTVSNALPSSTYNAIYGSSNLADGGNSENYFN